LDSFDSIIVVADDWYRVILFDARQFGSEVDLLHHLDQFPEDSFVIRGSGLMNYSYQVETGATRNSGRQMAQFHADLIQSHLVLGFNALCALVKAEILPVIVFDGPSNVSKKDGGKSSLRFPGGQDSEFLELCAQMGLPFLKAPMEAEALLAALERHGLVGSNFLFR
jgi:hypothetical protein